MTAEEQHNSEKIVYYFLQRPGSVGGKGGESQSVGMKVGGVLPESGLQHPSSDDG